MVDFRPLAERNFAACCIIIFCAYGILYGASTSLPGLLQSLFGYDAYVSGLVQSPSGVFSIMGLIVVGTLIGRGVDARWLITAGLLIMAAGNYWMALMNLYISPGQVIWPRVVLIVGLSMIFVSINVAAFKYIPPICAGPRSACSPCSATRGAASARPLAQAFEWRREHFHTARVGEFLDPLNPAVNSFLQQGRAFFFQQTGDPAASQQMALQSLDEPPPAAGRFTGLLRRLLALRRPRAGPGPSRPPHEALGGRKGGAHRSGVDPTEWATWTVWLRQAVLFTGLSSIVGAGLADSFVCADRSRFAEGDVLVREAVNGHTRRK